MRFSIETEMENLNRDYAAIKSNYDQLLASREQASMSKKVDDQAEALKFKIADAPNTPLQLLHLTGSFYFQAYYL